jgi:hypothetical protein
MGCPLSTRLWVAKQVHPPEVMAVKNASNQPVIIFIVEQNFVFV